jgi:hypothetical protein
MGAGKQAWGWYPTGKIWVPMQVAATGKLVIDPTAIFEEPPTNGEMEKAATSNWSFDHDADPDAHHARLHTMTDALDHTGRIALSQMTPGGLGLVLTGQGAGDPVYAAVAASPGEGHITILPYNYNTIGQGTWAIGISTAQALCYFFYNGSNANLDNFTVKAYLAAGTYTLRLLVFTQNTSAILDIDINGVEVASFDLYSAGVVYNVIKTQTAIVVAASGLKTLTFRIHGRNGASTGWCAFITTATLWRTA